MLTAEKNMGEFFPQSGNTLWKMVHAEQYEVLRSVRRGQKCNFQLIICPLLLWDTISVSPFSACFPKWDLGLSGCGSSKMSQSSSLEVVVWVRKKCRNKMLPRSFPFIVFGSLCYNVLLLADDCRSVTNVCALVECDLGYSVSPLWNHCLICVPLTSSS